MLARSCLTDDRTVDAQMELNQKLYPIDGVPLSNPIHYHHLVGALVHLTISRLNITYVDHVVSQFIGAQCFMHCAVVLHILRYLRRIITRSLLLSPSSTLEFHAYFEASWVVNPTDRQFCVFLSDSLIS